MEMNQTSNRIHPLMVGAAVSVMLVSLAGVAAITGLLPNSHGTAAPMASTAAPTQVAGDVAAAGDTSYQYAAPAHEVAAPVAHHNHKRVTNYAATDYSQAAPSAQYAQTSSGSGSYPQPMQQPVQQPPQQPTPQHSTVGIATGAVIGGLLGNQVGGGNGRALATIAGAVGGGYLGDVVGKKSGY
jgi:uncharacterized protein YcfJ